MSQNPQRAVRPLIVLVLVCAWGLSLYLVYRACPGDSLAGYRRDLAPAIQNAARGVVAIDTEQHPSPQVTLASAGSGFILETDGVIVTNEHVIHNADVVRVTLANKRRLFARVVAADARSDIALLQVDATDLEPLELAPAEHLKPGQVVIALGNPLGTGGDGQPAATFGRIARLNARLSPDLDADNDRFYDNLIQSTATTLPGSSGGPLLDEQGRAVGINTAMGISADASRQFGFAIPLSPRTRQIIHQLKQGTPELHAFLGVETIQLDPDSAEKLQLQDVSGALVSTVLLGSPAQQAGIRPGDLIRAFDDTRIYSPEELISRVNNLPPESIVHIHLLRPTPAGPPEEFNVPVRLTKRDLADLQGYTQEARLASIVAWGIEVKPLTDWRRRRLDLPPAQNGVLVYSLTQDSPAKLQGVKAGQIITQVGPHRVDNLADFAILAQKLAILPTIHTAP